MRIKHKAGMAILSEQPPPWRMLERRPIPGDWLYLEKLVSFQPPRSGVGKQLLEEVTEYADHCTLGLWVMALPPKEGGIGQKGLEKLYRHFGFVKCPDWTKVMLRKPKRRGPR